jgi:hypothetical protein
VAAAVAAGSSSSSSGSGWSHLYLQQRICVKKKAGSLPYVDDPSGVKSLLFKAFYSGGSSSSIGSSSVAADAEDGESGEDDGALTQQQQQQGAFDIVHLCNTFSADPHIQAFAQVLRAATAAGQHVRSSSKQLQQCAGGLGGSVAVSGSAAAAVPGSSAAAAAAFLAFCHGALYECIVQEKTAVLPWYLQLYSLGHRVCAAAAAAGDAKSCNGKLQQLSLLGGGLGPTMSGSSLSPGVQLQDLVLALGYYNSSIAAAAELCRTAAVRECSSSSRGGSAAGQQQQQQQEAWQVEALGWMPLLQPGFCDGLWQALQQQLRQAGLLPSHAKGLDNSSSSSSDVVGRNQISALEAYIATGSIQAAAAARGAGRAAAISSSNEVFEQLLGGCLAMLSMPSAVEVQRASKAVLQQQPVAAAAGGILSSLDAALLLPALAGHLGPGLPGPALAAIAAAVVRQQRSA